MNRDGTTQAPSDTGLGEPGTAARLRALFAPGIGRKLLILILLFSSLVTLALTAGQLYLDYQRDVNAIERRIDEIRGSYLDSITRSLWNVDTEQLRIQLEGIRRLPDMRAVEVSERGDAAERLSIRVGAAASAAGPAWNIPIVHSDRAGPQTIGTLRLEATLDEVHRRLVERALTILASQGIKTFLVSFFILFIVHRLVTRHLTAFAEAVGRYDVRRPWNGFRLDRRRGGDDELDRAVSAFDSMRGHLEQAYRELNDANAALERDIAARRAAESTAAHLAYHDPLTGLPNRRMLLERLQQDLAQAVRRGTHGAVLFLDLDNFKNLNDALGHSVGDQLLVDVARRLQGQLRDEDVVARLGGDEFVVVLADLGETPDAAASGAHHVADKLHRALGQPFDLDDRIHHVSFGLGIALFPHDASDTETLLRHADTAMYRAKAEGRNGMRFFEPAMQAAVEARHALEGQLWQAMAERQFSLAYQPLFDGNDRLVGAEALIRWQHPERGWISPADFIPAAEEAGSIIDIGQWVLETAARQRKAWREAGCVGDDWHMAVNVSPRQFHQPDFVSRVVAACEAAGTTPAGLVLEITEGVLVRDSADAVAKMEALRRLGARFHIDDFGTGYSSLAYLKSLPVDGIKIDQSFVRDLGSDPDDVAIIEAIVAVARRFRLALVAEGVETAAQQAYLRGQGCDCYQGFLLGRPVAATAFADAFLQDAPGAAPAGAVTPS